MGRGWRCDAHICDVRGGEEMARAVPVPDHPLETIVAAHGTVQRGMPGAVENWHRQLRDVPTGAKNLARGRAPNAPVLAADAREEA